MLGDSLLVRTRGDGHDDTVFRRGRDVHRVIADADAGHYLQSRELLEHLACIRLGSGQARGDAVELVEQVLLGHLDRDLRLDALEPGVAQDGQKVPLEPGQRGRTDHYLPPGGLEGRAWDRMASGLRAKRR